MFSDIKNGTSKLRPALLLAFLQSIIEKLTGNLSFPDLPIDLTALNALATAFANSIAKATQGTPSARAARDAKVLQVRAALNTTADYIRLASAGNAEMLASSGFPMRKQPEPVGPIGTPLIRFARMTGITGQTELAWFAVHGSKSYQVWQTETDPAEASVQWTPVASTTKVRLLVNGLVSFKAYWFCVEALGAEGAGAKSEPVIGRAA
jgi:hypothetical protein